MKRFIWLVVVWILAFLMPAGGLADFNKTKIAVLDFQLQGETFQNPDMGTIVAEWFITAMVREGRFDVVERRLLQQILSEQKLAMTGVVDADSATQIGKLLGVKVIITGSVMKLRDVIEINARIIDVESASIITAENVRGLATTRMQDMVIEMSQKIMKNFPLEGYVVNRSGETVTLDLGNRTGVKKNMQFIVYKEGLVIKHPKTGEVLDVERIQTGVITITGVMQKTSKAKIEEETSPGSINYGQMVKSLVVTSSKESRLYIDTSPANARIRILNIGPIYRRGMVLAPGPYHVEVSAPGYKTMKEWLSLGPNEEKSAFFSLIARGNQKNGQPATQTLRTQKRVSGPAAEQLPAPALTPEQKKYIRMLESSSIRQRKDAAKLITKAGLSDPVILDVVERELLEGFKIKGTDRHHVDTMSWFCKALGASGLTKYRETLNDVATNAPHRKLRGYARKSLAKL